MLETLQMSPPGVDRRGGPWHDEFGTIDPCMKSLPFANDLPRPASGSACTWMPPGAATWRPCFGPRWRAALPAAVAVGICQLPRPVDPRRHGRPARLRFDHGRPAQDGLRALRRRRLRVPRPARRRPAGRGCRLRVRGRRRPATTSRVPEPRPLHAGRLQVGGGRRRGVCHPSSACRWTTQISAW